MRKFPFVLCLLLFVFCSLLSLNAYDWGLQLNQSLGVEGVSGESQDNSLTYSGTLVPWFSLPFGSPAYNAGNLYLSAGVTLSYPSESGDRAVLFIPELLRTELSWRIGTNSEIKIGRMNYSDPLGIIANGLFDGARFSFSLNNSSFSAGLWYTGLLYKKSANITMTDNDMDAYREELDYARFGDTYFAPRRIIAAFDWNNPYLANWLRLKASLIAQFDLSGSDDLYHSQYLAIKAAIPVRNFVFDLGGCLELAEQSEELKVSLAGEFGIGWMLPTPIRDMLRFSCLLTNAAINDSAFAAFVPITTIPQGEILQAKFSGLSMFRLDYTARLHETFSINIVNAYFIASDYESYQGFPQVSSGGRKGNFLGYEVSGRLIWSPFSDLQLNLGGGIFLPSMGNTGSQSGVLWRVNFNVALAIF